MHKFSACWRYNTPCTFLLQWRSLNQRCLVTLWTERNHIFSDKGFLQRFYIKWWVLLSLLSFHYLWLFTSPYLLRTTQRELFYFWLQLVPQTTALSGSHRRHQTGFFSVLKLVARTSFLSFFLVVLNSREWWRQTERLQNSKSPSCPPKWPSRVDWMGNLAARYWKISYFKTTLQICSVSLVKRIDNQIWYQDKLYSP